MKKNFIIGVILLILLCMPVSMALSESPNRSSKSLPQQLKNKLSISVEHPITTLEEPPSWANGNFSGVWGIDIWGEAQIPLGWIAGYFRHMNLGYFLGGFAEFGAENASAYIEGFFLGPFMFGQISEIPIENETVNATIFVGLGGYDETQFYWRIMGYEGPTFFMYGEYAKFD
jgi:hypothetical protein